ncbi:FAD-binding oxidoreductase [Streptosporangium sp. NBC_01756]|uniref:FAD-binding oxidoreductase n=1 Tax=Streptosporangium sp. NBC_01756 TaxID=2975950 RepID=UPI002DDC66AA|nr:FAD-binding oxidoreductase [Streptosporangium sp. NBC_01756]WSC85598.1 FAD-binding oxidoreductase [Streptosporangium sp. NBC_01756]
MDTVPGQIFQRGQHGYDDERLGINRAAESHPAYVFGATGEQDVAAAVRLAAKQKRPVAVLASGHGPSVSADDAVLISTSRMDTVRVDPAARTAWIEAGARWRQVLEHTTPHGLAPLNGSSPDVGAVGYLVGGGAGLLGRRFGFAADHVRRLRVVTADGRVRDVSPDGDPDLFWAVRGGKDNFGVVTGMEIDLFPVSRLYGGGLYFPGEATPEVMRTYAEWTRRIPEEMASSVLLAHNPDLEDVPEQLRGRFVVHVRIAYSGAPEDGEELVRPLRDLGPRLLDSVRDMPYAEVGTIHHEPTSMPFVAYDRNILLRPLEREGVDTLVSLAGPQAHAPFIAELRHFQGAYSRSPKVANCVGGRDAAFSLFIGTDPAEESRRRRDELFARLRPWSTGGVNLNFMGVEEIALDQVRRAYTQADFDRLTQIKAAYDPDNMFRLNFNIPPRSL